MSLGKPLHFFCQPLTQLTTWLTQLWKSYLNLSSLWLGELSRLSVLNGVKPFLTLVFCWEKHHEKNVSGLVELACLDAFRSTWVPERRIFFLVGTGLATYCGTIPQMSWRFWVPSNPSSTMIDCSSKPNEKNRHKPWISHMPGIFHWWSIVG